MGFTQRFTEMPSLDVLEEIESVVTIDQTPPGAQTGVSTGVVCCVGEFADVTFAVAIDASGVVTTNPQPTELFGPQDQIDKLGGFDETIGEFGGDHGNGFVDFASKPFSRRVVVPINLASSHGARVFRKLPTNESATLPSPVVPVSAATVIAGREFKSGNNRVRNAQRVQFTSSAEFASAIDGAVTLVGAPATVQSFTSAGGGFTTVTRPDGTVGVRVGDAFVLGVIGGAGALGSNADTYRVQAVTSDTVLGLEKQNGATFDWITGTAQPFRIHVGQVADSGLETAIASAAGFRIPQRPLDATVAASVNLTPTIVPAALTATSADPLSGLAMRTDPSVGLLYTAAVQAPNVASSATMDALYSLAIDALIDDDLPEREVNVVWASRTSDNINAKLHNHVLSQKINGIGRIALINPPLDQLSLTTVLGDTTPGVGARRARETQYCWPGQQIFIREAVGTNIRGADGNLYKTGTLDVPSTAFKGSILSLLAPERNAGQASEPVKTCMSNSLGIQRGVSGLGIGEYKRIRARGISAPRKDRDLGMVFQSDVTTSLATGEKELSTRRFSFYIQDSIASIVAPFVKEVMTPKLQDDLIGLVTDFYEVLLSPRSAPARRIRGYQLDAKTGNTRETTKAGIFLFSSTCEMLLIARTIVHQATVGNGVLDIDQLSS